MKKVPKVILLVEDEVLIALNESQTLEKNGYTVITAGSGDEAVSIIRSEVPVDLILMDINLGCGISGTEAAEIILSEVDLPLVFMSSHTNKAIVDKTENITAYGYIVKNSGETVMLTSIKMAFKLFDAKKAEIGMLKATNIWKKTIDSIKDSIILIDCENRILQYNKAFSDFVGAGEAELYGRKCMEVVHGTSCQHEDCPFKRMKVSNRRETLELELKGTICEITMDPLFDDKGRLEGAVHIISDISDHQIVKEKLEHRIANLTNPAASIGRLRFEDLFNMDEIQKLQEDFAAAHGIASLITKPDGTPLTRASNLNRFCSEFIRGTEIGLADCNASDRDLRKLATDGPKVSKCKCCELWDAGADIRVGGELIAYWFIGQVRDENSDEAVLRSYLKKIGADEDAAVLAFNELPIIPEKKLQSLTKLLYTMAETLSEIAYKNHQQAGMIFRISEAEKKIKQLYDEKNLLLKEVHHRVKNNISSLGALLEMQLEFTKEPEAISAIKDAIARIKSARVLYEKLLNSEGYDVLPVRQFVMGIYNEISLMFPGKTNIHASICIDEFFLETEMLFPLGIMINEMLTNMFKHAFSGKTNGEIIINILNKGNCIEIELMDDGAGFPDDVSMNSAGSYGLKLVRMLALQIGGTLNIENRTGGHAGTACRLKIMTAPQ